MWKHLNILLKKMLYSLIALMLCVVTFMGTQICQASGYKIAISCDSSEVYTTDTVVNIGVHVYDNDIYSEGLYVSYHINDYETGETLVFDNERKLLVQPSKNDNVIETDLTIKIPREYKNRKLQIVYDIVDVNKGQWLSQTDNVLTSDITVYSRDFIKGMKKTLSNEITSRPVIFGVNIVITILFIITVIFIKKKKLL